MPDPELKIIVDPEVYEKSKIPAVIINRAVGQIKINPFHRRYDRGRSWQETVLDGPSGVRYVVDLRSEGEFIALIGFRRTRSQ